MDAEFCMRTDGGELAIKNGKRQQMGMQTSEKNYVDFKLEVRNNGGHSSRPVRDNAIYHLAEALTRLAHFDFPVRLNETTRGFFEPSASLQEPSTPADFRAIPPHPNNEHVA